MAKLDALVIAYLGVFLDATEERISQPSTPPYPYGHTIAPPPSHLATRIQERPSIPFRQFLRSSMPTQPRPASQIPFHPIKPLPLIRRQPKFVAAQACISRSCDQNGAWTTPRTREDEVVGFVQALKGGI